MVVELRGDDGVGVLGEDLEGPAAGLEPRVEPGAVVETTGYVDGLYPLGITIGEVSRFVPATGTSEPYVTVRPAADFSTLDYVAVIMKPPTDTSGLDGGAP